MSTSYEKPKKISHNMDFNKMAKHEFAAIDPKLIYMWIKSSKFSQSQYLKYLNALGEMKHHEGVEVGYNDALVDHNIQ